MNLAASSAFELVSQPVQAEEFSVDWRAPAECGTRAQFEAGVTRIVGRPFAELDSSWSKARVSIEQVRKGFRLAVSVVSARGASRERSVLAGTCGEAVEAAELIVATSLTEPDESSPTSPAAPAKAPEATPTAAFATPASPATINSGRSEVVLALPPAQGRHLGATHVSSTHVDLGARIGLEAGLLPEAAEYAGAVVGLEYRRLRLEAALAATTEAWAPIANGGSAGVSLRMVDMVGCYTLRAQRFRFLPCAGVELGQLRAEGQHVPGKTASAAFWSAGVGVAEAGWDVSPAVSFAAGVDLLIPFRPMKVTLRPNNQPVFQTPDVALRPFLGLALRFW